MGALEQALQGEASFAKTMTLSLPSGHLAGLASCKKAENQSVVEGKPPCLSSQGQLYTRSRQGQANNCLLYFLGTRLDDRWMVMLAQHNDNVSVAFWLLQAL